MRRMCEYLKKEEGEAPILEYENEKLAVYVGDKMCIRDSCKVYPNGFEAVKDFNLEIADQEFIIFVGPSGLPALSAFV